MDGDILNQVLIPLMNIDRRCLDGTVHEEETLNKSQIFVTTAGYKNTFPYQKLITLLIRMVLEPGKAIVMGGTWRIPVLVGLQSSNFVDELKRDGTYNDAAFEREYESRWSGTVEDAFFNGDLFDRARRLQLPEWEYSGRSSGKAYYILSVDVGRRECDTVICAIKVSPQSQGSAIKSLVNIFVIHDEHFQDQAIAIKRLYYKYKARAIVMDGNGLGIGLVDYMVKSQIDDDTGDILPDFGVINDPDGEYRRFRTPETELDALYVIKANAPINTEAHTNVQTQLRAGKIRFLIDDRVARNKLMELNRGKKMTPEERADYLKPFILTSILKEEMMNLREESQGVNIILKQANRTIQKDKFSAFEYGLYYIKQEEDKKKKRTRNFADYMFIT